MWAYRARVDAPVSLRYFSVGLGRWLAVVLRRRFNIIFVIWGGVRGAGLPALAAELERAPGEASSQRFVAVLNPGWCDVTRRSTLVMLIQWSICDVRMYL